jgi:hypothetical protein
MSTLIVTPRKDQWDVNPLVDECFKILRKERGITHRYVDGPYIDDNRNGGISDKKKRYQKIRWKRVICWDSDVYPDDPIAYFDHLMSFNLPVVGGAYPYKEPHLSNSLVCGYWADKPGIIGERLSVKDEGLKKVDWVGTGMLSVDGKMFEKVAYPWFECVSMRYGNNVERVGEDLNFCKKVQALGIDIYVDTSVILNHKKGDVMSNQGKSRQISPDQAYRSITQSVGMITDGLNQALAQIGVLKRENAELKEQIEAISNRKPVPTKKKTVKKAVKK